MSTTGQTRHIGWLIDERRNAMFRRHVLLLLMQLLLPKCLAFTKSELSCLFAQPRSRLLDYRLCCKRSSIWYSCLLLEALRTTG
jgi:hypothetical protein